MSNPELAFVEQSAIINNSFKDMGYLQAPITCEYFIFYLFLSESLDLLLQSTDLAGEVAAVIIC